MFASPRAQEIDNDPLVLTHATRRRSWPRPPRRSTSRSRWRSYCWAFSGLELLEPGVVTCTKWRPEPGDPTADTDVYQFCGLARKP
jgi:hypothetical protein